MELKDEIKKLIQENKSVDEILKLYPEQIELIIKCYLEIMYSENDKTYKKVKM